MNIPCTTHEPPGRVLKGEMGRGQRVWLLFSFGCPSSAPGAGFQIITVAGWRALNSYKVLMVDFMVRKGEQMNST